MYIIERWLSRPSDRPVDVGHARVPNRVLLAPLAGIGNWFVRLQAKRYGAGMAVSEMVSTHAIHYGNERTCVEMLRIDPRERDGGPVSIQLFGEDPESCARRRRTSPRSAPTRSTSTWAARCRRCCKTGAGAALLADPDRAVALAPRRSPARRAGRSAAGDGQAALGPAPGRDERLRARTAPRGGGGRRGDRVSSALGGRAAQGRARLRARGAARRVARGAGDPDRRPAATPRACARRSSRPARRR